MDWASGRVVQSFDVDLARALWAAGDRYAGTQPNTKSTLIESLTEVITSGWGMESEFSTGSDAFGGEFVDDLRVDVDLFLQLNVFLAKAVVRCFCSFRASIELLKRSWHLALCSSPSCELFGEVGVFVGQYPSFYVGFDSELDDAQGTGRALRCAVEEPRDGCLDRVAFRCVLKIHDRRLRTDYVE